MKKELSFYRGCSGSYESRAPNYAKIVGEGKHQQVHARPYPPRLCTNSALQVLRFLEWLHLMTLPQVKRKPNFQVHAYSAMRRE